MAKKPLIPRSVTEVVLLPRELRQELGLTVKVGRSSIWVTQSPSKSPTGGEVVVVGPERWEAAVMAMMRGLGVDVHKE